MLQTTSTPTDRRRALQAIVNPPQEQVWREAPGDGIRAIHDAMGWLFAQTLPGSAWRATGYHNHSFVPDAVLTHQDRRRGVVCRYRLDTWFLQHDVPTFTGPLDGVLPDQPGCLVVDLGDGPAPGGDLAGLLCITAAQLCAWSLARPPVDLLTATGIA